MRLTISLEIGNDDEEQLCLDRAKELIEKLKNILPKDTKLSLFREGDRSAGNLLLPKLNGRFGDHLQNRKAKLEEI